ncbi:hypothetical protein METUNv1_03206 [Methyloversatilis universalis FAM5]|uniref:Uncharacterized protein n=1 Tax=Methyloversatilis universalis (strain ATCC BAA-1314 / DSM 25237 / JCM 13912 / CCUG 52030 / FAM5) TaxID=1000565 RepID=F5RGA9_METUF|nr:hypothetical protein METUNv1_03206 [Methyloversatilis universalis FAM5]
MLNSFIVVFMLNPHCSKAGARPVGAAPSPRWPLRIAHRHLAQAPSRRGRSSCGWAQRVA